MKKSEQEILSLVSREIHNASGYIGGELVARRKKSLEYYLGMPLGNEQEGRSQVISNDVMDTVESLMPSLMKIFTAGDNVFSCEGVGAEDEEMARQCSDYLNHIFYKQNNGFTSLYTVFKDALIQKNGILKIYWDNSNKTEREEYTRLTEDEFNDLVADAEVDVKEHTEYDEPITDDRGEELDKIKLHDCVIHRTRKYGQVRIEPVPPEEFLIERRCKSIDTANFVCHRTNKTKTELVEMGYDKELVDSLPTGDPDYFTEDKFIRHQNIDFSHGEADGDDSTQDVLLHECYVRMDLNDDGKAELVKICVAGDSKKLLSIEEMDTMPFISMTPVIMPHRFHGRSIAELVEDIQLIKSTVMRQMLDNMYLTNNNRVAIMDGMVNLDDLLTSRPGGVVRTKQPPQQVMMPMQSQTISQQAFPLLEYLDTIRETRTGITRYNQGLDADSLNKTATGVNAIMTQSQMRMELIARVFSETGIKDLFRRIFELTCKYQDKERIVELNNQFVPVKPTEWRNKFNVSISVGLGSGSKEQQIMMLNNILERQLQAFNLQGGQEYPMVSLKNIYNSLAKIIENAGLKNVENYFVNPDQGKQMVQPKPPPPLTPIEKIEFTRIQSEEKRKIAELELENKKLRADTAEALLSFETKAKELELKYNTQVDIAKMKADADLEKLITNNINKTFLEAQRSSDTLQQQVSELNEQRPSGQAQSRDKPIEQS